MYLKFLDTMHSMTTSQIHPDDVRVVPEFELCDRLARSLRLFPLSHGEIAELFGVNVNTVSRWLNGRNKPSKVAIAFWADMTGVDRTWLETGQAPTGTSGPIGLVRHQGLEPRTRCYGASRGRHLSIVKEGLTPDQRGASCPPHAGQRAA